MFGENPDETPASLGFSGGERGGRFFCSPKAIPTPLTPSPRLPVPEGRCPKFLSSWEDAGPYSLEKFPEHLGGEGTLDSSLSALESQFPNQGGLPDRC